MLGIIGKGFQDAGLRDVCSESPVIVDGFSVVSAGRTEIQPGCEAELNDNSFCVGYRTI